MAQNEVETILLNHRTIRKFTTKPIPDEQVTRLLNVAQMAANTQFMQSYSMLRIKDSAQLAAISKIGNHDFVADHGELVIFIADQNRNIAFAKDADDPQHLADFDHFLAGVFDATLAAQNFAAAAESEGLGTLIMSSILNDVPAMVKLLHLPQYTFPLFGVAFGEPNDKPEQKPRLPHAIHVMTDTYHHVDDYEAQVEAYDKTVYAYYNTRTGQPRQERFTHMVSRLTDIHNPKRADFKALIEQQGFKL